MSREHHAKESQRHQHESRYPPDSYNRRRTPSPPPRYSTHPYDNRERNRGNQPTNRRRSRSRTPPHRQHPHYGSPARHSMSSTQQRTRSPSPIRQSYPRKDQHTSYRQLSPPRHPRSSARQPHDSHHRSRSPHPISPRARSLSPTRHHTEQTSNRKRERSVERKRMPQSYRPRSPNQRPPKQQSYNKHEDDHKQQDQSNQPQPYSTNTNKRSTPFKPYNPPYVNFNYQGFPCTDWLYTTQCVQFSDEQLRAIMASLLSWNQAKSDRPGSEKELITTYLRADKDKRQPLTIAFYGGKNRDFNESILRSVPDDMKQTTGRRYDKGMHQGRNLNQVRIIAHTKVETTYMAEPIS